MKPERKERKRGKKGGQGCGAFYPGAGGTQAEGGIVRKVEKRGSPPRQHEEDSSLSSALSYYTGE